VLDVFSNVVVDGSGNVVVSGTTFGQIPTLNAYDSTYNGNRDLMAVKFTSTGSMLWSTYYGGPNEDTNLGLRLASNDSLIFKCKSAGGFAPMINSYNATHNGGYDAVFMKCAPNGTPVWSTYFGGSGDDQVGIMKESNGSFYFSGITTSTDFPVINPYQASYQGGSDGVVGQISAQGTPIWSSYLGGSGNEYVMGMAPASNGAVFFAGHTSSSNFPTYNAFLPVFQMNEIGYIARFSSTHALEFSSFLYGALRGGPRNIARVHGVSSTAGGNLILIGQTLDNFNATIGLFPPLLGPGYAGYLLVLSGNGTVPVDLSAFSAHIAGNRVQLAWITESESGNMGFAVQRTPAPASDTWETCAFIPGAGTSTTRLEYAYWDDPPPGLVPDRSMYYRLKQIDTDGRVRYSGIVEAVLGRGPEGFAILDVHPQPSHGDVAVRLSGIGGEVTLRIIDALGRTVRE
jgi:hypothetical protein